MHDAISPGRRFFAANADIELRFQADMIAISQEEMILLLKTKLGQLITISIEEIGLAGFFKDASSCFKRAAIYLHATRLSRAVENYHAAINRRHQIIGC